MYERFLYRYDDRLYSDGKQEGLLDAINLILVSYHGFSIDGRPNLWL